MTTIIEHMFIKRFCLPCNYTTQQSNIRLCYSHYNHIACIFTGKKAIINNKLSIQKEKVLCYGVNHYTLRTYRDISGKDVSIHAEEDALIKLPANKNKKIKKINILVLRFTKHMNLSIIILTKN